MQILLSQKEKSHSSVSLLKHFKPILSSKYTVRLSECESDVEQAFKLRYEVFNLELGEGLSSSIGKGTDKDDYDAYCDHLIVVENNTNRIVGTYRIQCSEIAEKGIGFYSSNEFKINLLPDDYLTNGIELGRACIAYEHRNSRVLFLLWKGIAKYIKLKEKRFLFGCCSLNSVNPDKGWQLYRFLKEQNHLHGDFFIPVQGAYQCESRAIGNKETLEVPVLLKMYLKKGAKVCSPPAIDRAFKTIDYLIVLDVKKLDYETKHLFFTDN